MVKAALIFKRWLDPDNYPPRLLSIRHFPFFPEDNVWVNVLTGSYAALLAIFAVKLLRREVPLRLSLFCLILDHPVLPFQSINSGVLDWTSRAPVFAIS